MELQLPKNTVLCLKVVPDCFRSRKQLLLHMNIPALSSDKDESMTSPSSISLIVRLLLELHDPFQYARIRSNPGVIAYLQSIDSLLQVIHKSHSLSSKSLATAISLVQEYQKPIQNSESPTIDLIDVSHHLEQILSLAHSIAGTVSFSVVTRWSIYAYVYKTQLPLRGSGNTASPVADAEDGEPAAPTTSGNAPEKPVTNVIAVSAAHRTDDSVRPLRNRSDRWIPRNTATVAGR